MRAEREERKVNAFVDGLNVGWVERLKKKHSRGARDFFVYE